MPTMSEKLEANSVDADDGSGCRLWVGARRNQYGRVRDGDKIVNAHRAAWVEKNGPVPPGFFVMHDAEKCRRKHCISNDHLKLGTPVEAQLSRVYPKYRRRRQMVIADIM